jgi:hypothetical protein
MPLADATILPLQHVASSAFQHHDIRPSRRESPNNLFFFFDRVMSGVWRFASVVSLIMYAYAGLGMILMQCSGVNSEHSNTVNFDSMFDPPEFCSVVVTSYYSRFKVWIHDHHVSTFDDRFLGQSDVVRTRSPSCGFLLNMEQK